MPEQRPDTPEEYHAKMEAEKDMAAELAKDEEVLYPLLDSETQEYTTYGDYVAPHPEPGRCEDDELADAYRAAATENLKANRLAVLDGIMDELWVTGPKLEEGIELLSEVAWETAEVNGFHSTDMEEGTAIALMHEELSEALWAVRHGNPESKKIEGFSNLEEEMADVVIRVMDFCQEKGLRLSEAVVQKMIVNAKREYMHGKEL